MELTLDPLKARIEVCEQLSKQLSDHLVFLCHICVRHKQIVYAARELLDLGIDILDEGCATIPP